MVGKMVGLTCQKSRSGKASVEYVGESDSSSSETARPSDYVQLEVDFRCQDGAQINVSAKSLLKGGTSRASMGFH